MTDTVTPEPIPITGLKRSQIETELELHFTGGIRGRRFSDGWRIGPLLRNNQLSEIAGISESKIASLGGAMGTTPFGIDEISAVDPMLTTRMWMPFFGLPDATPQPSDTWGMIASGARSAGAESYAGLARNLSASLRAAGLHLRSASDGYHRQLAAALARDQKVGMRFANISMIDLHLAFHSILAEMASSRDYLAQVAVRRCNGPNRIDALSRLKDWLEKPANRESRSDALISRLLSASDVEHSDPWLADITEYRNLFLHREHISAGGAARWMLVEDRESPVGAVRTITMPIKIRPRAETICDALTRFAYLYKQLGQLADFAASLAPYPAAPPHFVVKDGA
jgi:hypothetical protein